MGERMNYKCPYCGTLYEQPGVCMHGKAEVQLKYSPVVTGSRYSVFNNAKAIPSKFSD